MRLTTSSKGLLFGCAMALAAVGCGDDKKDPVTDSGTQDSGTDAGTDSGPVVVEPVLLRFAHLAYGTGVGAVHVCAHDLNDPNNNTDILVTTDALANGEFQGATSAVPITYGSISRHVELDGQVLQALANKRIDLYPASALNPTFGVLALCGIPNGVEPLASATLGVDVNLVPGEAHTLVITGADGDEIPGTTPGPALTVLTDSFTAPAAGEARARIVLANPRYGDLSPGFCHILASEAASAPQNIAPVLGTDNAGLVHFVGSGTTSYFDIAPVVAGGTAQAPDLRVLTLHLNTGSNPMPPCGVDANMAPTGGIFTAGAMPNPILIASFAAGGSSAATIRAGLEADTTTTVFIAPFLTRFVTASNAMMECDPTASAPGTCLPAGIVATDAVMQPPVETPCALGTAGCAPKGYAVVSSNLVLCPVGASASCMPAGIDLAASGAACILGSSSSCAPCAPLIPNVGPNPSCPWVDTAIPVADVAPATP